MTRQRFGNDHGFLVLARHRAVEPPNFAHIVIK
jgi:hypothetical protein